MPQPVPIPLCHRTLGEDARAVEGQGSVVSLSDPTMFGRRGMRLSLCRVPSQGTILPCGKCFMDPEPGVVSSLRSGMQLPLPAASAWLLPVEPGGASAPMGSQGPAASLRSSKSKTLCLVFSAVSHPGSCSRIQRSPRPWLEMGPWWEPCSRQLFCNIPGMAFPKQPASVSQPWCSVSGSLGWNREVRLTRTSRLAALFVSPASRISSFPPPCCQHRPYPLP